MGTQLRETWEEEIFLGHRWGSFNGKAEEEHSRLKKLWEEAQPVDDTSKLIISQICTLEICNWNLETSILALCEAIGAKRTAGIPIGHLESMDSLRWRKIWAYYFTLRSWLAESPLNGYRIILAELDRDKTIQNYIYSVLGEKNRLKELYAERFVLCLEFHFSAYPSTASVESEMHKAAVEKLETEIRKLDPSSRILNAMWSDGEGRLNPCHHKAFRRYDIILSSIGSGKWRGNMPVEGTDGAERAELVELYIAQVENWINGKPETAGAIESKIYSLLGDKDNVKIFLASLLSSLMRSQQVRAKQWGEGKVKSDWHKFLEKADK